MLDIEVVEKFYQYFYVKKYRVKYQFKRTKTTNSVCTNFLKILDKKYSLVSLSEGFLWEYFLFQFHYWEDLTLQNQFSDKITIAFIVGKKAFERWETRNKEYDWQIETFSIVKAYSLDKKHLFTVREQKSKSHFDSSKRIRKVFHNTDKGFATCIEMTTLFDPTDTSCTECIFRSDCKELLRVNYPNLYKERIN
jgi:hypothetical protein